MAWIGQKSWSEDSLMNISIEFIRIQAELNPRHCEFAMDVLDLFRIALYSLEDLRKQGVTVDEPLKRARTFDGFDHNHHTEAQMSDYARFLVEDDKWAEQKDFILGRERGNSHHQTIPTYSRMLTAYREVKQNRRHGTGLRSYLLSEEELGTVQAARVHPSSR
jgi:uncharacterized protein YfbU (UPF0304 family)